MLLHLLEHAHLKIIPALLVLRQLQLSIHRANLELSFLARQQSQASLTRSLDPSSKIMIFNCAAPNAMKMKIRNITKAGKRMHVPLLLHKRRNSVNEGVPNY